MSIFHTWYSIPLLENTSGKICSMEYDDLINMLLKHRPTVGFLIGRTKHTMLVYLDPVEVRIFGIHGHVFVDEENENNIFKKIKYIQPFNAGLLRRTFPKTAPKIIPLEEYIKIWGIIYL